MTDVMVAGGPGGGEEAPETTGVRRIAAGGRYRRAGGPRGSVYRVAVARKRLTASLSRGDNGYIAEAPEVDGLGYGASPMEALSDLQASVEQYLEILRDGAELAPRTRHHADFLPLLDVPRGSWFAAVRPPSAADAADVE